MKQPFDFDWRSLGLKPNTAIIVDRDFSTKELNARKLDKSRISRFFNLAKRSRPDYLYKKETVLGYVESINPTIAIHVFGTFSMSTENTNASIGDQFKFFHSKLYKNIELVPNNWIIIYVMYLAIKQGFVRFDTGKNEYVKNTIAYINCDQDPEANQKLGYSKIISVVPFFTDGGVVIKGYNESGYLEERYFKIEEIRKKFLTS